MGNEMREPTFWILTSLVDGPRHGYAVLEEVQKLSRRAVELKVATLYAALDRLTKEGLIAHDHDEVVEGRTRRYFRLTDAGDARLRAEVERMQQAVRQARRQFKGVRSVRLA